MRLVFWIPGVPVGVPRPRARHIPGPDGGFTHIYTPETGAYKLWRKAVELLAGLGLNRPAAPLEGPIRIDLVFLMPRPQCYSRKRDPEGVIWAPTSQSDWDNLGKITDVCTRMGYWHDDRQVCDARVRKCFHAKGGSPGALFVVARIEGEPDALPREIPGVGNRGGAMGSLFPAVDGGPGEPVAGGGLSDADDDDSIEDVDFDNDF